MWSREEPFDYPMYLAVPLTKEAEEEGDLFDQSELFHRVGLNWKLAETIASSPFAESASKFLDADISLGEDPYFEAEEVPTLLEALDVWRKNKKQGDEEAFALLESLLLETRIRGRGILFKF